MYINEPLSMLQRFTEQMEYSELLEATSTMTDSCLRMAYVVGFAFSMYSNTINRLKKPFNPLLGETYEYENKEKGWRMISEQVSHHPPISAGFAESKNFRFWANTDVKTTFWGKSIDIKALGPSHVILNKNNDHIVFWKPNSTVQNIILGTMYVDTYGEMSFKNYSTGDTALITFKLKGWTGRNAFEANGVIKDANGNERYLLDGKWNKNLILIHPDTKHEKVNKKGIIFLI